MQERTGGICRGKPRRRRLLGSAINSCRNSPSLPLLRAAAAAVPLLLAACAENPSAPAGEQPARWSAKAVAEAPGRREYACFFSGRVNREPLWYLYTRGTTRFPRAAEAADGSTSTYRYRTYDDAGVVRLVRCEIPATERAMKIMDRRLGVQRMGESTGGSALMDGGDGGVTLPGLEVNACQYGGEYPYCDPPPIEYENGAPPPEEQPCDFWASCGGGGGEGSTGGTEPDQPEPCETSDVILASTVVQTAMNQLFLASNPDAKMAERRERGGWIVRDPFGGHRVEPFPDSWTVDACEIRVPQGAVPPTGTVAWIHTHPYTRDELLTSCDQDTITLAGGVQMTVATTDKNDPSGDDGDFSTRWKIPGYVIDKDKITNFVGDPNSVDRLVVLDRIDRCGY